MDPLDPFEPILRRHEPLAPYTLLRLGGPAEILAQPRSREELSAFVEACYRARIPLRVLGSGCNLLVRDEGVRGVVLRLSEPAFTQVTVDGQLVRAATGASVSALISAAARHGLAGVETLVGIPGTVGGALRINAGDRTGDIGQFVRQVEVMNLRGEIQVRERDELRFREHNSNLDDPVLLGATFALERDGADAIVKRMRKAWILRKSVHPLAYQAAGRVFRDPRGLSASGLIEQAGLARTRVGGAEVSDRDANYIVVHPGATSRDVLRLMDLIESKVRELTHVELERELTVW
jgi:UDP-N-acetylmuramate dehydrogenase